jgi:hypothetical protein
MRLVPEIFVARETRNAAQSRQASRGRSEIALWIRCLDVVPDTE